MRVAQRVVKRPVPGITAFGLIAVAALYPVSGIAIDMFPEMDMLAVTASTSSEGPETVEKSVTRALEAQLVNLSGLSEMTTSGRCFEFSIYVHWVITRNTLDLFNNPVGLLNKSCKMLRILLFLSGCCLRDF
jgi:multidrug efflux pump subunit AcrB